MKVKYCAAFILIAVLVSGPLSSVYAGGKHKSHEGISYKIDVSVNGLPAGKVYMELLRANDSIAEVDSQTSGQDGHIVFSGSIPESGLYRLRFQSDKYVLLSLYGGDVKITGNWPLDDFEVTGSASSQQLKAFIGNAKAMMFATRHAKMQADSLRATGNEAMVPDAEKVFFNSKAQFTEYIKKFSDTTSYQANAIVAARVFNPVEEMHYLDSFNAKQKEMYPRTMMTRDFGAFLLRTKEMMPQPVEIGDVAPELKLQDTSGNAVQLSSLRGKYVLVDFWASWCGPCRGENPNVVTAFNQYKGKNFTVFGVSLDNKPDAWLNAIHHDGLGWQHASDLKGWQSAAASKYGVRSIPTNFLLDPKGVIIAKNLRGPALEEKLQEVLK